MKLLKSKTPKYILIGRNEIYTAHSMEELNIKADGIAENPEFKRIGETYVAIATDENLQFIQDKKRMLNIPWQRLSKKDNTVVILQAITLILIFITLVKG